MSRRRATILGLVLSDPNYTGPLSSAFDQLGIDIEWFREDDLDRVDDTHCYLKAHDASRARIDESRYVGGIILPAVSTDSMSDAAVAYCRSAHPWLLGWPSYHPVVNKTTGKTFRTGAATFTAINAATEFRGPRIPSDRKLGFGCRVYNAHVKEDPATAPIIVHLEDASGNMLAWQTDGSFYFATKEGVHLPAFAAMYLTLIGYTAPRPYICHIDGDDIDLAASRNCLSAFGQRLAGQGAVCLMGLNPGHPISKKACWDYLSPLFREFAAQFPLILHDHARQPDATGATYNYTFWWDAGGADVNAHLALYDSRKAATESAYGITLLHHLEGYLYSPWNAWSEAGLAAAYKRGVRVVRSSGAYVSTIGATAPHLPSGPGKVRGLPGIPDARMSYFLATWSGDNLATSFMTLLKYATLAEYAYQRQAITLRDWMRFGQTLNLYHGNCFNTYESGFVGIESTGTTAGDTVQIGGRTFTLGTDTAENSAAALVTAINADGACPVSAINRGSLLAMISPFYCIELAPKAGQSVPIAVAVSGANLVKEDVASRDTGMYILDGQWQVLVDLCYPNARLGSAKDRFRLHNPR